MINIYYGHLRDATVTSTLNYETSYPVSNLKVLNKNRYAYINDNGVFDADALNAVLYLLKIDFGVPTSITSCVLDVGSLAISLSNDTANFGYVRLNLQGSTDNFVSSSDTIAMLYDGTPTPASDTYSETLTDIYESTFTEVTYRYYRITLSFPPDIGNVTWDIDGKINNLYIGDYAELPCPELKRKKSIRHGTKINEALGGGRSGYYTHARRQAWTIDLLLSETQKDALEDMDEATYGGALPVYFEEEGLIDPIYARVTGEIDHEQDAYQYYRATLTVEEEL